MNRKIFSIIVIITTVISIVVMTKPNGFKNIQENKDSKLNVMQKIGKPQQYKDNVVYTYTNIYKLKSYGKVKAYKLKLLYNDSISRQPKNEIKSKLTLEDKDKILDISKILAPVDYARIEEYIKMSNQEEGIPKALKLLRSRLTNKDYGKIEDIARSSM